MSNAARRAERIAVALVTGAAPITPDAIDDLRLANREREIELTTDTVRAFQSGAEPWAVPAVAPWAGFGAH